MIARHNPLAFAFPFKSVLLGIHAVITAKFLFVPLPMTTHAIEFKNRLDLLDEINLARLFLCRLEKSTRKCKNHNKTRESAYHVGDNERELAPKVNLEELLLDI